MSRLRDRIIPELLVLQTIGQSLFRPASTTVKQLTRDIINRMDKPILLCDCHGHCIFYNESFAAFGPKDGMVAFTYLDLAGIELNSMLNMSIPIVDFRDELVVDGGQKVPVLLDVYPLPTEHGERMGSAVLVTDITKEVAAVSYREQMSFLLDAIPLGLVGISQRNDIMVCNRSARILLGLGDTALEGKPVEAVLRNIEGDLGSLLVTLIKERKPANQEVPPPFALDVQHIVVESSSFPKNNGRLFVFRNKTSSEQIEDLSKLHEKTRDLFKLAPKAVSEIKNSLTTVRGFVEVFGHKAKEAGFADSKHYVNIITTQIDVTNSLIDEFFVSVPSDTANIREISANQVPRTDSESPLLFDRDLSRKHSSPRQRHCRPVFLPRKAIGRKRGKRAPEPYSVRQAYALLIESLPLGFLAIDHHGTISATNRKTAALLDLPREKILHQNYLELVHPLDRSQAALWLSTGRFGAEPAEIRLACPEGECWVIARKVPLPVPGLTGIIWEDVNDRKRSEALHTLNRELMMLHDRLQFVSTRDTLTGLFNRRYFEEEIHRLTNPRFAPISVIIVDMDGLKQTNDSFGHQVGDELIQAAAQVIKKPFRETDMVARIGGDEFAVLLPQTPYELAQERREEILREVEGYNLSSDGPKLSLSVGVATSARDGLSLAETIKKADDDMYRFKRISHPHQRHP